LFSVAATAEKAVTWSMPVVIMTSSSTVKTTT
jgi:hypothetical protein